MGEGAVLLAYFAIWGFYILWILWGIDIGIHRSSPLFFTAVSFFVFCGFMAISLVIFEMSK